MRILTNILIILAVITTALPFVPTTHWWIRIFDFPRAQIAVVAIIALFLAIYEYRNERWRLAGIATFLIAAIAYQSSLMVKYTPLYPIEAPAAFEAKKENTLSIMMFNVKMDNDRYADFLDLVERVDPDIILMTEPDEIWANEVGGLSKSYPYQLHQPLDNTYGMILFSKLQLHDEEINYLVLDSIPSMFGKIQLPSGVLVNLHGLHPEPPKPGTPTYDRDTEILLIGNRIMKEQGPSIVAGDLNDVAWSSTSGLFQERTNMLDPRVGRGFFNTYSVFFPLLRYPLDHYFYSKDFNLVELRRLEDIGSDHFPILIILEYYREDKRVG